MLQTPHAPTNANERMLASRYRETFTSQTGTALTLSYMPARTVNDVGLEQVYKNGALLTAGGLMRESVTSLTGTTITLTRQPAQGTLLLCKNGLVVDAVSGLAGATETRERQTGLTTTALTLATAPLPVGTELIWKNGSLLDPNGGGSGYTISGASVTLGTAASSGDVFVARYRGVTLTYSVSAKVITLSTAAVAADVWTVLYACNGLDAAGYTISGKTLTLATALVASDVVVVDYPYRPGI